MSVYSISLLGKRPQNEDNHEIILNLDSKDTCKNNVNLYAVFDGHGGKQVSNYLKENLPKFFTHPKLKYPLNKKYVNKVYNTIQDSLKKHAFSNRMGSTGLVVVHFKYNNEDYINVINNGDSRCVMCRDNFAMPLTKDHKPNWPEEFYRITALGGVVAFDGYDWRIKDLSVSRSFGDVDATPYLTHVPDLFRYKIDKSDKFMIISCDGLYESLSSQDAVNFVLLNCYEADLITRKNKNVNIAKMLGEYAIKRGSGDNVSLILIFME